MLGLDERVNVIRSRYFNTNKYYESEYDFFKSGVLNIESDETLIKCDHPFSTVNITLSRIAKVAPEAEIILTIREQRDLLCSAYKHDIRIGSRVQSFSEFLSSARGIDFISMTHYSILYDIIKTIIPKCTIHVFLFENLKKDYEEFMTSLYQVLGLEVPDNIERIWANPSPSEEELAMKSRLSKYRIFKGDSSLGRFEKRVHTKAAKVLSKGDSEGMSELKCWDDQLQLLNSLSESYRIENREFMMKANIDLSEFGYLC
jgi:hypothetical protein